MKLYSIHKFAKILNITPQTLRNWDKSGKLVPYYKKDNGYRYYTEDQLNSLIGKKKNDEYTIGYCRVYKCEHCGLEIDRDLNASINLKNTVRSTGI